MVTDEALSHLQADYRLNARLSVEERLRWIIQDRWINYSRADKILTRLAELVCYPPRARMPSVLVFGGHPSARRIANQLCQPGQYLVRARVVDPSILNNPAQPFFNAQTSIQTIVGLQVR